MFYLLFIPGESMTPDDSEFTRSKVKVTMVTFVKQFSLNIIKTIDYRAL